MKFKHLVAVCLCFVLAGCSTAAGVSKGNTFYSERNPNIRIQVDPSLKAQDPFSFEKLLKGGDAATAVKYTLYPFAEIEGTEVKRAFYVLFADITVSSQHFWRNAGDGEDKDIDGVSFRAQTIGNFVDQDIAKEAAIRGFRLAGQYSAVLFKKMCNRERIITCAYFEKTPGGLGMYWGHDRMSPEQKEYLGQLELRGREAFTVSSYSMF